MMISCIRLLGDHYQLWKVKLQQTQFIKPLGNTTKSANNPKEPRSRFSPGANFHWRDFKPAEDEAMQYPDFCVHWLKPLNPEGVF